MEEIKLNIDEKGIVTSNGIRNIILTTAYFTGIQKTLEEIIGPDGAASCLYRAGFQEGMKLAKVFMEEVGTAGKDVFNKYVSYLSKRGWGILTVKEYSDTKVVIVNTNSIASEFEKRDIPSCHSMRGILGGIMQAVVDPEQKKYRIHVEEVKCVAKGDEHCEFVITLIER